MTKASRNSAVLHKKLTDLTPESRNANKGTPRGNQMIEDVSTADLKQGYCSYGKNVGEG